MPTLTIATRTLAYEERGSGHPCIVLHGGPGLDGRAIGPRLPDFDGALRLITLDLPGHGGSSADSPEEMTLEAMADTVAAFSNAMKLEKPILLGWSIGGAVSLLASLRHPALAGGLLLVGAPAKFDFEGAGPRAIAAGATDAQVAALSTPEVEDSAAMGRLWATILPMYLHPAHAGLADTLLNGVHFRPETLGPVMGSAVTYDVRDQLDQIRIPVLAIAGETDFMVPPSLVRALADALPAGTFEEVAGTGHFPFAEEPERFAQSVLAWLAKSGLLPHRS